MLYIEKLIKKYPELAVLEQNIKAAVERTISAYENGGKVLICGNGGSAADSEHIAGELLKGFLKKRPLTAQQKSTLGEPLADSLQQSLPAVSLVSQSGIMTAVINDLGVDSIFAQQVMGLGNQGDILIGISTSGNAKNVVNALKVAKMKGLSCIALTGEKESEMSALCDVLINVPAVLTPDIQEYHLPVYHCLCAEVETHFFKE